MADEGLSILNSHQDFLVDIALNLSKDELLKRIVDYDCLLVRSQTTVDHAVIAAGKNLKLIGRAGVGLDNIDTKYAKEGGITVINTPSGNSVSTAELALGLILSLARKIPFAYISTHQGEWQRNLFKGIELSDKTLGIIGFGNVGQKLATRAKALDMKVIVHDPFVKDTLCQSLGVVRLSLDEVLRQADFVSLHCILNEETKNIINDQSIAKMKPKAFLINTARGELIDERALIKALDSGRITNAAIDVFRSEPPAKNDPLINHPKILVTPHLGASTVEAQLRVSTQLAEETVNFFAKRTSK